MDFPVLLSNGETVHIDAPDRETAKKSAKTYMERQKAAGRWVEQPKTPGITRDTPPPPSSVSRVGGEPSNGRLGQIAVERGMSPLSSSFDWMARNLSGAAASLNPFTEETGQQAYLRTRKGQEERASHEPPPLQAQGALETGVAGTASGLGELATIFGPAKLGAVSKLPAVGAAGRALSADPGLQALFSSIGGIGTEATGSPEMGAALGMGSAVAGMTVGGLKRLFFGGPGAKLTDVERLYKEEVLRGLKNHGFTVKTLEDNIAALPDNAPLGAADPVIRQITMEALGKPGIKDAVVQTAAPGLRGSLANTWMGKMLGINPTAVPKQALTPTASERGAEWARGVLKEPSPIEQAKLLRDTASKAFGTRANMAKWEEDINGLISKEHQKARTEILHKTVDDKAIARLNDEMERNPSLRAAYDKLMTDLRGVEGYAPALPNDPAPYRAIEAEFNKRAATDKVAAVAWLDMAHNMSPSELAAEAKGTAGLTEDLLDRFMRHTRDTGFAGIDTEAGARQSYQNLFGDINLKISQDLASLQGKDVAAWKESVAWFKGLNDAMASGKQAAADAARGNINKDAVVQMINGLPRDANGNHIPEMLNFFRKSYADTMLTQAETNVGSAIEALPSNVNQREVTSAIFGTKKAEQFYKGLEESITPKETISFARGMQNRLGKIDLTPQEMKKVEETAMTGVKGYQALRHWIGPAAKDVISRITGSTSISPLTDAQVREYAVRMATETQPARKAQFVKDIGTMVNPPGLFSNLAKNLPAEGAKVGAGFVGSGMMPPLPDLYGPTQQP